MPKKYQLTDEASFIDGNTLVYRIQARVELPSMGVRAGDLGGFVESEENLSHEGDCWIADDARVLGRSLVQDDAIISGDAMVRGESLIRDSAVITGYAQVESSVVSGDSFVSEYARLDKASVIDSKVSGTAMVGDSVTVLSSTITNMNTVLGQVVIHQSFLNGKGLIEACSGSAILVSNSEIQDWACVSAENPDGEVEIKGLSLSGRDVIAQDCATIVVRTKGPAEWTLLDSRLSVHWDEEEDSLTALGICARHRDEKIEGF